MSVALGACSVGILVLTNWTLGSALTGLGAIESLPLGSLACLSVATLMVLTLILRRIMKKKKKHHNTFQLTQSTMSVVEQRVSTALVDNEQIADTEFGKIVTCLKNYYDEKDRLQQPSTTFSKELNAHAP